MLLQNPIYSRVPNYSKNFIEFKKSDIEQSIPSRFEEQVSKYPHHVAIKSNQEILTYADLNKIANQLARAILAQSGTKQEPIALLLEQGASFIANILAILKLGKIYVPLDPLFPRTRLNYILEDSQATLIVTNNQNLELADELAVNGCHILNIDDIDQDISPENLHINPSPDTPAYIIYTSGSTGKPKGVLQNHRNVLHYCMNNTNAMGISAEDRMTLLYSCSVMGAVRCIFNTLLNGASLYPLNVKKEGLTNLVNLLISEEITIYHSVTTLFRHFVDILTGVEHFPKLRVIRLGGEAALKRDMEFYKQHFPDSCVLYSSLGSTETGTIRDFIIHKHTEFPGSTVPIGYPVEDVEILLLNEAGIEVKCGEVGEIAVKSQYLALGYWGQPELTQEKFLPHPSGEKTRIYRTGDLGRMEPDGCLIHMGRKDFQVKIRGFRVEIAEIEMSLLKNEGIKEVVVMAREDVATDQILVAYVVKYPESTITAQNLRGYLQNKLPDYMIPGALVFLDSLPLTPNGKIDRLSLPLPILATASNNFIAPRNDLEYQLTQIWQKILPSITSISINDNFFDLGGNSLLVVRLFTELDQQFAVKLPLATILQSGTIETLAQIIHQEQLRLSEREFVKVLSANWQQGSTNSWSSLVEIQPRGSKPPLFCIHPLGGEILCYRGLANHLGSDQPVYGLQPAGLDGKQPLYDRVEDMALHYIQQIQAIQPQGPYFLVGYSFGGIVVFEMAQQLYKQGSKLGLLALIDTCRPGYHQRLPFLRRVPLHLENIWKRGPEYLWQKATGWQYQHKYHLQERYKHYLNFAPHVLDISQHLSETDRHLDIIGANAHALSKYNFQVYPGQVTLFRTEDQNRDNAVGVKYDPLFGWGDVVTGGLDIHYIPGSHLSLLDEPYVQVLAEKFQVDLSRAQKMRLLKTCYAL